jgi:hypothetical protein
MEGTQFLTFKCMYFDNFVLFMNKLHSIGGLSKVPGWRVKRSEERRERKTVRNKDKEKIKQRDGKPERQSYCKNEKKR